jgi:hypothetical protein
VIVALACLAALAFAFLRTPAVGGPASGNVTATPTDRVSAPIARGVAVLEPSASITWSGAAIRQLAGDVFYRIEPGAAVTVTTPHGVITTGRACLRVVVGSGETTVTIDEGDALVGAARYAAGARAVLR